MDSGKRCSPYGTNISAFLLGVTLCGILSYANSSTETTSDENAATALSPSEQAYHLFFLALSVEDNAEFGSNYDDSRVVFKDGDVQQSWLPVSDRRNEVASTSLFHHDQYADRISFDFSFGSFMSYDIRSPTCSSSDTKIAKPKVMDFQLDLEEQSGSFTVAYDCRKNITKAMSRDVTVSIVLPVVSGLSLFYSFRKTCGGGKHPHMEFGYFEASQSSTFDSIRVSFAQADEVMTAGPHLMSTKLFLHLHPPASSQEFFHSVVTASSDRLSISTRGPTFGAVLKASESAIIHVLYECYGSGIVNVTIRIPIYPFEDLYASWKKDCGGGLAEGLNVGTSMFRINDVVDRSVTQEKWRLALQTASESISPEVPTLNTSTRIKDFWLSNRGIPVHVAPPIITVEDQAVLTVFSTKSKGTGMAIFQEPGGLLPRNEYVRMRLRLVCKKKGSSLVVVTFPVQSFSNIEFGFLKQCLAPKTYVHSGFLRTANSVMVTASFFMTAGFAYWWIPQFQASAADRPGKTFPSKQRSPL